MKATTVNKFRFISSIVMFSVVLIFGIVFLTLSLKLNKPVPENYEKAEAVIIRIEEELSPVYDASDGIGADDYDHRVFVEYTYKGKTYSDKEYANYNSSMKEGDTVLVYINPDKPEEFISDPSGNFIFVLIGIVIILVGAGGIGYNIYEKKRG